jgi:hypothetical protein
VAIDALCQVVSVDNKGLMCMYGNSPYMSLDTPRQIAVHSFS